MHSEQDDVNLSIYFCRCMYMQVPACVHAHQKRIPDTPRTGGCEQPNVKSSTRSRGALKRSKVIMSLHLFVLSIMSCSWAPAHC